MANTALKPFSGDLDKTPSAGGLQPFDGNLDADPPKVAPPQTSENP